jgi:hypothetical protein
MKQQEQKFEAWAVVEIFGHQTYVGKVTEQTIGGCSFVRVDVPALAKTKTYPGRAAFTKLFGQGAIYAITPMDEAAARRAAEGLRQEPVTLWIPPVEDRRRLGSGADDEF